MNSESDAYKYWEKLNSEYTDIIQVIRDEWKELIDGSQDENKIHEFLAKNNALCWGRNYYFSISKLDLGGEYVPDFVLVSEEGSLGLKYTLVEIEKPNTTVFTQNYDVAAGFTHAQKQIRDWKNWISSNSQSVNKLFPAKFSSDSNTHIDYMLIIGKRASMDYKKELERCKVATEVGYKIRSFDFITDNLNKFRAVPHISPNSDIDSDAWERGDFHKMANPFFKSISNKSWKEIASSPELIRVHMIGKNSELLLNYFEKNETYDQFVGRLLENAQPS